MIIRLYRQVYSAFNKKTGLYDLIENNTIIGSVKTKEEVKRFKRQIYEENKLKSQPENDKILIHNILKGELQPIKIVSGGLVRPK